MSADNIQLIRQYKNGWFVWQDSMSDVPGNLCDPCPELHPSASAQQFKTHLEALEYAHSQEQEDYIEYGTATLTPFPSAVAHVSVPCYECGLQFKTKVGVWIHRLFKHFGKGN